MENIDTIATSSSSISALQPNPAAEYKDHDNASANKLPSLDGVNTVGRLQEMAQAKKWKMPLYQERGTINSLQCVKCTFQDITTEGWSTTKKEAKKKAAAEMLAQLNVSQSFGSTSPLGSPITSTTTSASEITNPTIVDVFNIPVSDHLIDLGITTDNEVSLNITTEEMSYEASLGYQLFQPPFFAELRELSSFTTLFSLSFIRSGKSQECLSFRNPFSFSFIHSGKSQECLSSPTLLSFFVRYYEKIIDAYYRY
uniref:DRBM domain-containing protein n=1 Tax=Timema poppense TaxID=170557 RepID=A0A7R9CUH6_TIMPO|nr:unnamed protein product [Timema poppensis]